ncbi:hypothetical protein RJT34_19295 [Clitoria ternatea]|uniref:Uncharacterized protein n=1 Tax=Clitoria ternatea TaxID=43366 RepID=A0AAN9IR60_CLITE
MPFPWTPFPEVSITSLSPLDHYIRTRGARSPNLCCMIKCNHNSFRQITVSPPPLYIPTPSLHRTTSLQTFKHPLHHSLPF